MSPMSKIYDNDILIFHPVHHLSIGHVNRLRYILTPPSSASNFKFKSDILGEGEVFP